MSRPEHTKPPDLFYNDTEAKKYATNSRMIEIQTKLSERALELLAIPENSAPKLMLDIGCGTGLSGSAIEKAGHFWVGFDISQHMLEVGRDKSGCEKGDTFVNDMGLGLPFRPGSFDGVISISALQWLCNADTSEQIPLKRINRFFRTLYACLARGSRAVFQFYPENPHQMHWLTTAAQTAGFDGGLLIDYPNSAKAKKYFLVLDAGTLPGQKKSKPVALGTEEPQDTIFFEKERTSNVKKPKQKNRKGLKDKEWLLSKKERRKALGLPTAGDSKYSGRRRPKF